MMGILEGELQPEHKWEESHTNIYNKESYNYTLVQSVLIKSSSEYKEYTPVRKKKDNVYFGVKFSEEYAL